MGQQAQAWDPTLPGQVVRLRANPGQQGITTGKTRSAGSRLLVQIQFGPNEKSYKPYQLLELFNDQEDIHSLLEQGRWSGPDDLRRILTFEKVKGHLTNIFYSMESSNTDFYAHQFKPVLKFLESPVGRLLVADEVGLGKTIEAMYIWKELQARADARRLLILCPAILREKWRSDLRQRFNLVAEITSAQQVLEKVQTVLETQYQYSFVCIASLEGLRPNANWDDESVSGARAELARLLDKNPATDERSLFDLVIIDEAHYLRNQTTANHRIGQLLRDASRYLLLLTATPIQTKDANLFQLLRILNPDDFFDEGIFRKMLDANAPVILALRLIWGNPPDWIGAKREIERALQSSYFSHNPVLKQIRQALENPEATSPQQWVELGYKLETTSLLSQYLSRSRKRDVLPERVERAPQTLGVSFSPLEKHIYDQITDQIRLQAKGKEGISLFRLIARQRQMASCMVAALQTWEDQSLLAELLPDEELFWEDFGIPVELGANSEETPHKQDLYNWSPTLGKVNYALLEKQDSKYQALIKFLHQAHQDHPKDKFVLFAYFRGTLHYLKRRLEGDGITTCLIMGDMGDKKWEVLETFRDTNVSVLLSSEVGSEGIDLQFCRFLINYDLPWNPMRVEQRIGRLDRLGQKAERISIINFSLVDTVEERILERLYERINIFRESIGDLETILGPMTEKLLVSLFEPQLTETERLQQAEATAMVILKQRFEQERLETQAVNMFAFSDHILNSVAKSRDQGRWLTPEELHSFVEDYFARYYPGTVIEPVRSKANVFTISLAEEAKVDLAEFLNRHRCATSTLLHRLPVTCCFDPKMTDWTTKDVGKRNELLDPTHPLIQWIRHGYETAAYKFHSVSALELNNSNLAVAPGLYVYVVHRWSFTGLRSESRLAYQVARYPDGYLLPEELSEALVNSSAYQGQPKPNAIHQIAEIDAVIALCHDCDAFLEEQAFSQSAANFEMENMNRCNVQQRSAEDYANRRQRQLQERIQRFQQLGNLRMVPATEGLLNKVNRELELKLRAISERRDISLDFKQLAAGLIFVQES